MIKEIGNAENLRRIQMQSKSEVEQKSFDSLINAINTLLMQAAQQGGNTIRVFYKTVKDNAGNYEDIFIDYYKSKGYIFEEIMEAGMPMLDISFREISDSKSLWLGKQGPDFKVPTETNKL